MFGRLISAIRLVGVQRFLSLRLWPHLFFLEDRRLCCSRLSFAELPRRWALCLLPCGRLSLCR